MNMFDLLSIIGILLAVAVMSLMFRDNPIFRIAEHTVVGAMAGHFVVVGYTYIRDGSIKPMFGGAVLFIVPTILGIMMFSRLSRWPWMVRYPIAVMTSTGLALGVRSALEAQIIGLAKASMLPIGGKDILVSLSNIFSMILFIGTMAYFIYTVKPTRHLNAAIRIGRLAMMGAFGAGVSMYMGNTYTYTIALLTMLREYVLNLISG